MRSARLFVLLALLVLVWSVPASAQHSFASGAPLPAAAVPGGGLNAYGSNDLTVVAANSAAFMPFASDTAFTWNDGRYMTVFSAMIANLTLPTGTIIEAIELEACDFSDAGEVELILMQCDLPPAAGCTPLQVVVTGFAATPGCGQFFAPLTPPLPVVDNVNSNYVFQFSNSTFDGSTRLRAARLGYRRQVSPAPDTATFSDVPVGHPLHQFVEALAASGITAGCGGGDFCPNAPVTRGQMAVFLAKALGLHWPF